VGRPHTILFELKITSRRASCRTSTTHPDRDYSPPKSRNCLGSCGIRVVDIDEFGVHGAEQGGRLTAHHLLTESCAAIPAVQLLPDSGHSGSEPLRREGRAPATFPAARRTPSWPCDRIRSVVTPSRHHSPPHRTHTGFTRNRLRHRTHVWRQLDTPPRGATGTGTATPSRRLWGAAG
jgi:hypothetical protein